MTQSEDEVPDASPSYRRAEEATIRVWRLKYPRLRLMPAEWDAIVEAVEAAETKSISVEAAIEQAFFAHASLGTRN